MDFPTLKKRITQLEQAGGTVSLVEAVDPSIVEDVERQLYLDFPESVKSFYNAYEYLQIGIHEFIWVRNLVDEVNRIHTRLPGNPINYLPMLSDGVGGHYYVICKQPDQSPPTDYGIVVYNPAGFPSIYEFCSADFLGFVNSYILAELDEL
jgi:hypothetical protein